MIGFSLKHIIAVCIGVILTSFFYFPVSIVGIPGANTKMIMAALAIPVMIYKGAKTQDSYLSRDFIILVISALMVSFTCVMAVILNNTSDYTYASYFISMIVWMAGAYTLVSYYKWISGGIAFSTIVKFLIAAGVLQCILTILISRYTGVENFFIRIRLLDPANVAYARKTSRLFGIGCEYDPGGIRLGGILILAGVYFNRFVEKYRNIPLLVWLYIFSFFFITVVGSMISRTTSVGTICALVYYGLWFAFSKTDNTLSLKYLFGGIVIAMSVVAGLYVKDAKFKEDFRFGFEGFVSLVEQGEWQVKSNDALVDMYVFPDNLHTWIVGDGYIDSTDLDPTYIGKRYRGYYMGTDVGYLRFIYYGGLIFLIAFASFFILSTNICCRYFKNYKAFFLMLLAFQFIVWFKVATDIFCLYAIFLAAGMTMADNPETPEIQSANG